MSRPAENATNRSIPARMLGWFASVAASRARLMLWLVLLVACASVGISVTQLQFRTSRADLMDPASRFAKTWKEYSNTFGAESDLMVVVQTPAPNGTLIRNVIDDLGGRLNREPEHFRNIVSNVDLTAMREKALLFLTPQQAQRTASLLQRYEPVVRDQQWSQLRAEQLARRLDETIKAKEAEGAVSEATWKSVERYASSLSSYMRHSLETAKSNGMAFSRLCPT